MSFTVKHLLLATVIVCLISICSTRPPPPKSVRKDKSAFCRQYIYAPKCRGVASKRDLQKLEPLLEEPRFSQDSYQDFKNVYQENRPWQENDSNRHLLDNLVRKITSRNVDYDTGTDDYI